MLRGIFGSGGGAAIGGGGTSSPSTIPRWTGPSTLGDSVITQNTATGTNIVIGGTVVPYAAAGRTSVTVDGTSSALLAWSLAGTPQGYANATATSLGLVANNRLELAAGAASDIRFIIGSERVRIDSNGNIYGTSGTTGMTNGFFYIPAAAGAPTGTPTAVSGRVPMYYDTTNNQFYVYNGAWKKVTLA